MIALTNFILLSILLFNGFFYKKLSGSSINPVTIISYFWCFAAGLPTFLLLSSDISPLTTMYIVVFIFIFSIPFYIFGDKTYKIKDYFHIYEINNANKILFCYFLLGFISFSIHLYLNGLSYLEYLKSPLEVTAKNISNKYSQNLNYSIFSQIAIVLMYPVAFLSGVFCIFNKKINRFKLCIYAFCMPLLFFLIFGDKGALFLVLFLFLTGFTVSRKMNNEVTLIKKQWFLKITISVLFLLTLIIIAFASRGANLDEGILNDFLIFNIRSYAFGHIHAFNDWFNNYIGLNSLYTYKVDSKPFGFYTFKGLYDFFNIDIPISLGIYDEYFNNNYVETNIYTVFRGLIYDFGIVGSYVIAFLFGTIISLFTYFMTKEKTTTITAWFIFFTILYSSYIVSSFIWKTTVVNILIVFITLFFIKIFKPQNHKIPHQ